MGYGSNAIYLRVAVSRKSAITNIFRIYDVFAQYKKGTKEFSDNIKKDGKQILVQW